MSNPDQKIVTLNDLVEKKIPRPIGLCWGGFDFLHAGHLLHFDFARNMCQTLIVGINADDAFPKKGNNRPVFPERQRAHLLALIEIVDYVTIYHGPYTEP